MDFCEICWKDECDYDTIIDVIEIWVDKETGVNHLWHKSSYAGGLTPLLDENGNPVISKNTGNTW